MVLATEKFADLAKQSGQQVGLDHARIVTIAHPVGGVAEAELLRRAEASVDHLIRSLVKAN